MPDWRDQYEESGRARRRNAALAQAVLAEEDPVVPTLPRSDHYGWQTIVSNQIDPFWINTTTASTYPTNAYNAYLYGTGYTTNANVWTVWDEQRSRQINGPSYHRVSVDYVPPSTRELQLTARRAAVRSMRRRVADRRAKVLLLDHLTPEQQADYERLQHFELVLPSGSRYRLRRGLEGNIDRIEDGVAVERLCVHVPYGIPHDDNVLTQKLELEVDEYHVRRLANIERLVAGRPAASVLGNYGMAA